MAQIISTSDTFFIFVEMPSSAGFNNIISVALGFLCVLDLQMNGRQGKRNCAALQEKSERREDGCDVRFADIRQHLREAALVY